jgi:hypothetical protein
MIAANLGTGSRPAAFRAVPATERTATGLIVCNDFGNNVPYSAYLQAFSQIRVPILSRRRRLISNLATTFGRQSPRPFFCTGEHGVELVQLRLGFPPARPKGAPVINFRSEGRRFPKGRCLIPASHFFEFTGTKPPKSKWKFKKEGEDWFCFCRLLAPDAPWCRGRVHDPDNRAGE